MTTTGKTRNGGQWTDARFHSFVKSALRSASSRWPPKYESLKEAFIDKRTNKKTGRLSKHYRCASCREIFPTSEVQVDHIDPVIPLTGFSTWDEVVDRIFCEREGFQVLCKACHNIKTQQERTIRKELSNGK